VKLMDIAETARFREVGFLNASEQVAEGVALVVLGIIALSSVNPTILNSIAVIVGGIALAVEGATLSARYAKALATGRSAARLDSAELSRGMSASLLAGLAGIVLGILAILGVAASALIGVALIVFGTAVMFDHGARAHIRALRMMSAETPSDASAIAISAATSTSTAAVLVAVGLIALGIMVLAKVAPATLSSAAFLGLGTYLLLEGTAASSWLMETFAEQA
jgi:uncharacterized membrane protein HdeD (DUF308 family)